MTNNIPSEILNELQGYLSQINHTPLAFVHSYGCQQNVADGERTRGLLEDIGYTMTDNREKADLILLGTCAVRGSAEEKLYSVLGGIKRLKREEPSRIVIVSGCMAQEEQTSEYIRTHYPYVDIVFGTSSLNRLPFLLLEHFRGAKFTCDTREYTEDGQFQEMYEAITPSRENAFQAGVPIMFGCNNFCTYCIVPYVRGRERSRTPQAILDEVRSLVDAGYKEIMLLGQNVNSYGHDLQSPISFAELLQRVEEIHGDFVIRFLSSHPKDATPELLDTILQSKKIGRHLHLPVQCGSNTILNAMNRKYTVADYLKSVDYLRTRDPDFSLSTDLIVGFPNESNDDFEGTLNLVRYVQYDNLYTYIYSKRTGTRAALMDDKISDTEKRERMGRLLDMQKEIASEHYKRFKGRQMRVLLEKSAKREGYLLGHDFANIVVEVPAPPNLIGQFVSITVTETHNWAVEGVICPSP